MLWATRTTRTRLGLSTACILWVITGGQSLGQTPTAQTSTAPTQAQGPIPVEVFQEPRPKHLGVPECRADSRATNTLACQVLRSGVGGWAVVNFMVDAQGKPFEVTVSRSTGNKALDEMAKQAIVDSTFIPGSLDGTPVESGLEVKYKVWEGPWPSHGARPVFIDAYRELSRAIKAEDRAAADAAMKRLTIQNLYEDAYFGMASYLYATKWGDERQQLEGLQRALAEEGGTPFLPKDLFKASLQVSLQLQLNMRLYAEALKTFDRLKKAGVDEGTLARLTPAIEQVKKIRTDESSYEVQGAMPEGNWYLHLFKRHFQAEVSEGYISQVKLRCQKHYVFFAFDPKLQYQVDARNGDCTMELIGAPGTRFKLTQF